MAANALRRETEGQNPEGGKRAKGKGWNEDFKMGKLQPESDQYLRPHDEEMDSRGRLTRESAEKLLGRSLSE